MLHISRRTRESSKEGLSLSYRRLMPICWQGLALVAITS
jgi:hypothetical protein